MSISAPLALMLMASTLPASEEPYGLRGAFVGMTLDEFESVTIPTDSNDARRLAPETVCQDRGAKMVCQWHGGIIGSALPNQKSQMFTAIGDGGGYIDFEFIKRDGEQLLAKISVRSNMKYLEGMLAPMSEVYGEPSIESEIVQNGYGAQFEKQTFSWVNSVSSITLETRCGRLNSLCLTIAHTDLMSDQEQRDNEEKGSAVDRL